MASYKVWAKDCYSEDFSDVISPKTKKSTNYRCCLCGKKADVTHHAYYTWKGHGDRPGLNLFPLCDHHHKQAHNSENWIVSDKNDPVFGRFNSIAYLRALRKGYEKFEVKATDFKSVRSFIMERRNRNYIEMAVISFLAFANIFFLVFILVSK